MDKKIEVVCEAGCEAGFIAVVDSVGEDTEYIECPQHSEAYQDPRLVK